MEYFVDNTLTLKQNKSTEYVLCGKGVGQMLAKQYFIDLKAEGVQISK